MSRESGWAWPTWRDTIVDLAGSYKVLGSSHPRARRELEPWYASVGIEAVWGVPELLARADIFCVDNSSAGFEIAACDRPTVWLDDETWRRDANHGLRFGEELPGPSVPHGMGVCGPNDDFTRYPQRMYTLLRLAIVMATRGFISERRRVTERVYGGIPDGHSSVRAAQAIMDWEESL